MDRREVAFHLPRGRYVKITVAGYKGCVIVDNTLDVDKPLITVQPRTDCDSEQFLMTEISDEPEPVESLADYIERLR